MPPTSQTSDERSLGRREGHAELVQEAAELIEIGELAAPGQEERVTERDACQQRRHERQRRRQFQAQAGGPPQNG
jgi:GAF domain-containing protein